MIWITGLHWGSLVVENTFLDENFDLKWTVNWNSTLFSFRFNLHSPHSCSLGLWWYFGRSTARPSFQCPSRLCSLHSQRADTKIKRQSNSLRSLCHGFENLALLEISQDYSSDFDDSRAHWTGSGAHWIDFCIHLAILRAPEPTAVSSRLGVHCVFWGRHPWRANSRVSGCCYSLATSGSPIEQWTLTCPIAYLSPRWLSQFPWVPRPQAEVSSILQRSTLVSVLPNDPSILMKTLLRFDALY